MGYSRGVHGNTRTAEPFAFRSRRSQARAHTGTDKLSFKLRDAGENAEDQPTVWRRSVHTLMQTDEMDSEGVELGQCVHELSQTPREAIVSIHQHSIELAALGIPEQPV